MRLGLYDAVLHDRTLPEAITAIADAGLTGLELNTGGFLPPVHIPGAKPCRHHVRTSGRGARLHPGELGRERLELGRPGRPRLWQQMDPVAVIHHLGELIFHAAAKDVRITRPTAELNGVLDNSFRRLSPNEPRTDLGG